MNQSNKKPVSFRLEENQQQKLKQIAEHFRVRESELFRYAIDRIIMELGISIKAESEAAEVLISLLEASFSVVQFFRLDAKRLEQIIYLNSNPKSTRLENVDLDLAASVAISEYNSRKKLKQLYKDYNPELPINASICAYLKEKYLENEI